MAGTLYIVSTPIGNLEDITLRALRILKEADLIAAEDTRHSRGLLAHFDIHTPLTSYHAFNERGKCQNLLDRVAGGENIALVTDAGTPAIADPGFFIVREATKLHEEILRGTVAELLAISRQRGSWKGEFVIGVAPEKYNLNPEDDCE